MIAKLYIKFMLIILIYIIEINKIFLTINIIFIIIYNYLDKIFFFITYRNFYYNSQNVFIEMVV